MATRSTPPAAPGAPTYVGPFITVTVLFGIFGFLTSLNNQSDAQLKSIFDLSYGPAMLVSTAWFFAYLVFSVPSAKLIEAVGYKRTMVISLFIMVVGALLFIPAANLVSFPLSLSAIFVLATGVSALQTSANPYVSILGPEHSAPARLTWRRPSTRSARPWLPWGAATLFSPIPARFPARRALRTCARALHRHCRCAAGAGFCGDVHAPARDHLDPRLPPRQDGDPLLGRSIWSYKHTVLGMVGIFFYVGVEIALAAIAIQLLPGPRESTARKPPPSWLRSTLSASWSAALWAAL